MELSDSMATKDQAIDAKDLDGLMEGVWAKGALGGLDDSQRLLDFYFFENHWKRNTKRIRIYFFWEWFESKSHVFSSKNGVARNSRSDCCGEGSAPSGLEIRLNPRNVSKPCRNCIAFWCFLHAGRSIRECDHLWGAHRKRICTGERDGQRICSVRPFFLQTRVCSFSMSVLHALHETSVVCWCWKSADIFSYFCHFRLWGLGNLVVYWCMQKIL